MKMKITFFLAFLVFVFTVNAQGDKSSKIFYLEESFETGIPGTWTIENTGDLSWEHVFDYMIANSTGYPDYHVAGILTSPAVDVTSASALNLIFDHYFWGMGSATAVVEVFDGTNWVEVSYASNYNEQVISVTDYINDAFQVRFIYDDGNTWELYWKLYDVGIYEQEVEDLAVTYISPSVSLPGETVIPQVTVRNYGIMDINFSYSLQVSIAGTDYDVDLDDDYIGQIGTGFIVVDCPEWVVPMEEGDYDITATITYQYDEDPSNNTKVLTCTVMNYPDATVGNNNGKFYKVDLDNGDLTEYGGFESIPFSMTDEYANDRIYRMTEYLKFHEVGVDGSLTEIDDANLYEQWTAMGYDPFNYAMAYDWNTNRMYMAGDDGASFPVGNPHLAYFDMETYELTYVGQINNGAMIVGMDFADDGFLYGVGLNGKLYKINVDEFDVEIVGSTGMESIDKDFQDVSYDRSSHILYGIFRYGNPWTSHFGSIDMETGEFTVIQDYEISNYVCFAITKEPNENYTLTFTVDDGTNPIEGAEIDINGEVLTTNASGNATIELVNGDYDYTVTFEGYSDNTGTVSIDNANKNVLVNMDETTGINAISSKFTVSPNPFKDYITVTSPVNTVTKLSVIDLNGCLMMEEEITSENLKINLSQLTAGIYFLRITNQSGEQSFHKIIKQ